MAPLRSAPFEKLNELISNRPLWISQLKFPVNFGQVRNLDKSGDKSWHSSFWGALLDSIEDLLPLDLRWFAFRLPEATRESFTLPNVSVLFYRVFLAFEIKHSHHLRYSDCLILKTLPITFNCHIQL